MPASWRLIRKGFPRAGGNRQDLAYQIAFVRVFGQRSRQEPMKTEWSGFSKALRKDSIGTVLLMAQVHGCLRDERVNVHFYTNCGWYPGIDPHMSEITFGNGGHQTQHRSIQEMKITATKATNKQTTAVTAAFSLRSLSSFLSISGSTPTIRKEQCKPGASKTVLARQVRRSSTRR